MIYLDDVHIKYNIIYTKKFFKKILKFKFVYLDKGFKKVFLKKA